MPIPLTQSEMDAQYEGTWYEHNCFTNMGVHYFSFNYQPDQDCSETIPFQVRKGDTHSLSVSAFKLFIIFLSGCV